MQWLIGLAALLVGSVICGLQRPEAAGTGSHSELTLGLRERRGVALTVTTATVEVASAASAGLGSSGEPGERKPVASMTYPVAQIIDRLITETVFSYLQAEQLAGCASAPPAPAQPVVTSGKLAVAALAPGIAFLRPMPAPPRAGLVPPATPRPKLRRITTVDDLTEPVLFDPPKVRSVLVNGVLCWEPIVPSA